MPAPPQATLNNFEGPKVRDRIVVLGRTRSGKTVYIARLYHLLWRAGSDLKMQACTGVTHQAMVEFWQLLKNGTWPMTTTATDQHSFDLEFQSRKFSIVVSDYPGEVFRLAFMDDNNSDPEVIKLLDSIDRAQAIIFLVDPKVMIDTDLKATNEQGFGLTQAILRLRASPGGEAVPISLVLTKYDEFNEEIKAAGGRVNFINHHYPSLVELAKKGGTKAYKCIAIQSVQSTLGTHRPDWDAPVQDVEEPLRDCLERVIKNMVIEEAKRKAIERARIKADQEINEIEIDKIGRSKDYWVVCLAFLFLALALIAGAWWLWKGRT